MKSEKPGRKGQAVNDFRQVRTRICYTARKRIGLQEVKTEDSSEDSVESKAEKIPMLQF